jgi:hypothetical protein
MIAVVDSDCCWIVVVVVVNAEECPKNVLTHAFFFVCVFYVSCPYCTYP